MARSLSDDPSRLENELSGLYGRARVIERRLRVIRVETEDRGPVTPPGELHKRIEEAKACVVGIGEATPEMKGEVTEIDNDGIDF
jgi:hypothetical protein